jgi:hypothetical protein
VASSMANRQTLGSYMAGERQELESIP